MTTPRVFRIISFFLVVFLFAPVLQACETQENDEQAPGAIQKGPYPFTEEEIPQRLLKEYEFLLPVSPSYEGGRYGGAFRYNAIYNYEHVVREKDTNRVCDGYQTVERDFSDFYDHYEEVRVLMDALDEKLSGYDPLTVFPQAIYLGDGHERFNVRAQANPDVLSEKRMLKIVVGASLYGLIKNNWARSATVTTGTNGVVLTTYWGRFRLEYMIGAGSPDRKIIYAVGLWMKSVFTYKDVTYCISVPYFAHRLPSDDPEENDDPTNGDKRTALSNTNVALAEPYMTELSRTLFDLLFAPRIPELNQ